MSVRPVLATVAPPDAPSPGLARRSLWTRLRLLLTRRRARILVINHFEPYLELLAETLRSAGYRPETLHPRAALGAIERSRYHVVIGGLVMPYLTGPELVTAVRQSSPRAQVILLSGDATNPRAAEALRRGAIAVLDKRALDSLKRWVSEALERAFHPAPAPRPAPVPVRAR